MRFIQFFLMSVAKPVAPRICSCIFIATLCTLLLVAGVFNWSVNPYGQYGRRGLTPIVQDTRSQKTDLFNCLPAPAEGLILGSSRAMKIETSYLNERTSLSFFNYGVNHGRPEDYLAILRMYQSQTGRLPHAVVFGVDIAALNDTIPADARISSEPRLFRHIQSEIPWHEEFDRYSQLLSLHQTKASFRSLARLLKRTSGDCDLSAKEEYFGSDGVIHYARRSREMERGDYDFEAALEFNQREFQALFSNFRNLSPTRLRFLREAVQLCTTNNCRVYLFTTVHHPRLREPLITKTKFAMREAEAIAWLQSLSQETGARFVDLGMIESFDGDPASFVDGIHPLEPNTRKMADCLFRFTKEPVYALQ
jgi:hypothetical protein